MPNGQATGRVGETGSRAGGCTSSSAGSVHARPGMIDPGDLARLNSTLRTNLRFAVEQSQFDYPAGLEREDGRGCRGARVRSLAVTCVLMYEPPLGPHLSAAFPVMCSGVRRQLLHSLAGSFAECAMTLGLGAGVYRTGAGQALMTTR